MGAQLDIYRVPPLVWELPWDKKYLNHVFLMELDQEKHFEVVHICSVGN